MAGNYGISHLTVLFLWLRFSLTPLNSTCCSFHCLSSLNWKCSTWLLFKTFRFMSCKKRRKINKRHISKDQCLIFTQWCTGSMTLSYSQPESESLPAWSALPSLGPFWKQKLTLINSNFLYETIRKKNYGKGRLYECLRFLRYEKKQLYEVRLVEKYWKSWSFTLSCQGWSFPVWAGSPDLVLARKNVSMPPVKSKKK